MALTGMPYGQSQCAKSRLCGEMRARFAKLARNESGVTAIEYAFIAGLVAIAIVAVVTTLGNTVSGTLYGAILSGF